MQLHIARLCLDCNDVHDAQSCPVCGSEAFAYLTRWIPAGERRRPNRPATSPEADVYRELIEGPAAKPRSGRLLKTGLGVAALGVAGWLWRRSEDRKKAV